MPNTKSAERRMRNSARKQAENHRVKGRLRTLERSFQEILKTNKKPDAILALSEVNSALDKAAKTGVIHRAKADRKKSRLAMQFNRAK